MQISRRCYAATGLGYAAPWCVNAGFIAGDRVTLIVDTGSNRLAAETLLGYATAVRPANELLVVNTEKHFDHIGGNGLFREHGVDVWGHAGIARTEAEFAAEIEEYNAAIPSATRRNAREAEAFFWGTRLTNPNRVLEDGMKFDLGGCVAETIATPGHTATNMSVWVAEDRVVYTGDCLIAEYLPNLEAGGAEDWRQWLESLERLEKLGAEAAVVGHGPVARGPEVGRVVERVRGVLREALRSA